MKCLKNIYKNFICHHIWTEANNWSLARDVAFCMVSELLLHLWDPLALIILGIFMGWGF